MTARLVLPAAVAALIDQRKPCPREGDCLFQGGCDCKMYGWEQPPLVSWWPSPDPLPLGPVEIEAQLCSACLTYQHDVTYHDPPLPGEVVATAVVTDVVPVKKDIFYQGRCLYVSTRGKFWLHAEAGAVDLSDLGSLGLTFTPGQWAVAIDQIEVQ